MPSPSCKKYVTTIRINDNKKFFYELKGGIPFKILSIEYKGSMSDPTLYVIEVINKVGKETTMFDRTEKGYSLLIIQEDKDGKIKSKYSSVMHSIRNHEFHELKSKFKI